ncbi:MAG: hypothetical protein SGPRY_006762 [Prymnesium sp.]
MEDLTPAGHELLRLTRSESGVLSLQLQAGENLVNRPMVDALHAALQVVEQRAHPKALIVSSSGKFFMNGLDLAWMSEHPDDAISVVADFWKLLARILTLDCHTVTHTLAGATQGRVAAINGHAFGAGIFLALSCDWRLMRNKRGFLCFPELNLGMRLSKVRYSCRTCAFDCVAHVLCVTWKGFGELAKAKLSAKTLREAILTGKRYASTDAVAAGIVDRECAVDDLKAEAENLALSLLPKSLKLMRFDATALQTMKIELYTDAYRALSSGLTNAEPASRL